MGFIYKNDLFESHSNLVTGSVATLALGSLSQALFTRLPVSCCGISSLQIMAI